MFRFVSLPSPELHIVWHGLNPTNVVWTVSGLCFLNTIVVIVFMVLNLDLNILNVGSILWQPGCFSVFKDS